MAVGGGRGGRGHRVRRCWAGTPGNGVAEEAGVRESKRGLCMLLILEREREREREIRVKMRSKEVKVAIRTTLALPWMSGCQAGQIAFILVSLTVQLWN